VCNDTCRSCDGQCKDEAPRRGRILLDSLKKINGERQDTYGAPEDSFDTIGALWTAYFKSRMGYTFTAHDVAMMMSLFKHARIAHGAGHMDSYSDSGGYVGMAADMAAEAKDQAAFVDACVEAMDTVEGESVNVKASSGVDWEAFINELSGLSRSAYIIRG
jgi:hypothetical protein